MKTMHSFTKVFCLLAITLSFVACEKESISEPVNGDAAEEVTTRDDNERLRDCLSLEPIAGSFCYEDGLTSTWVDNEYGHTSHHMESGTGKGFVVDANLNRIVFRSTTHKLGRKVLIHNMGCGNHQTPCVKLIEGDIYTQGEASYVKISAEKIFDCIWPQNEEFDFKYALVGAKL